ncbi:MAG: succinylglutamate desuccinylase/aspartoacylase family protein [Myxococcales bacterium]|nr:succinylglutamate desuccinylase/aspartoacylase family protein [Myxococcales bacterium]MCB9731566.1 succinylglutamate desuccinylase/aspartoacylase family protein [Deltaproteobacteria bacterium]
MTWHELEPALRRHAHLGTLDTYGEVEDEAGRYPLLRFRTPGRVELLITAGFHGNEQAGPISLAEHLPEIVEYAASQQVGLRIYPCVNPSGFDAFTRYNRNGEKPNNDVLRYELADGTILDMMRTPRQYARIHAQRGGPAETRAIVDEILTVPTPVGALDLHQDPYFAGPLAYAYAFGDLEPYAGLMEMCEPLVHVAKDREVDDDVHADENGLVVLHDGSISDWFTRRGSKHVAVVETTTDTPMGLACAVNLVWVKGFIDLCAIEP